jgi:hypothetical protein
MPGLEKRWGDGGNDENDEEEEVRLYEAKLARLRGQENKLVDDLARLRLEIEKVMTQIAAEKMIGQTGISYEWVRPSAPTMGPPHAWLTPPPPDSTPIPTESERKKGGGSKKRKTKKRKSKTRRRRR